MALFSRGRSHHADFGAFVEIEEGIDGLVPIGEITSKKRIRVPGDVLKEGQIVKVKI
ncbi:MAG TPA: S1 RNA-binding domain-containing protein [Sulfuricurvum sp.]|nr:S1 RNA-binding domain-containing protein [Sulfuricurvum sp.]